MSKSVFYTITKYDRRRQMAVPNGPGGSLSGIANIYSKHDIQLCVAWLLEAARIMCIVRTVNKSVRNKAALLRPFTLHKENITFKAMWLCEMQTSGVCMKNYWKLQYSCSAINELQQWRQSVIFWSLTRVISRRWNRKSSETMENTYIYLHGVRTQKSLTSTFTVIKRQILYKM
jgi:hypothetical protein